MWWRQKKSLTITVFFFFEENRLTRHFLTIDILFYCNSCWHKKFELFFFFLGSFPFYIAAAEQRIYFYNTTKGSALLPYNSGPKIALLGSWSAHSVLKGTLIGNKSQIPKDTLASIPSFPSKWTLLFSRLQSFFFFGRRTFFFSLPF